MTEKQFKSSDEITIDIINLVDDMKKGIKEHPVLKKYLDKGINEYGLTEEEALDCMISAWLGGYDD